MSKGKVILGTMIGLAAGAVLGMLLAPEKGSTTRRKIIAKGDDYLGDLEDKYNNLVESVTNQFESTKKSAEDFVSKGKSKFENYKDEIKTASADSNHKG